MTAITLTGRRLTCAALRAAAFGAPVVVAPEGLARMAAARDVLMDSVAAGTPIYGTTTGLGPRSVEALEGGAIDGFPVKTIRGRAHAVGTPLDDEVVPAAMVVRLNTLLIGAAGARPELADYLRECLEAGVTPVVGETASIGAADLIWGGMMGLALIGEGVMRGPKGAGPSAEVLASAGMAPYAPGPRDGLALASHSSFTAALTALGVDGMAAVLDGAETAAALSMEGFRANVSPLDPRVLALRPQPGQAAAARGLLARLEGSTLLAEGAARRLQDPLSIRNVAQVHGAVHAALDGLRGAAEAEINGASDNPAVLVDEGVVLSNGGYLTPHLTVTLVAMSHAATHLAAQQVARLGKILAGRFSGLPRGLVPEGADAAGLGPVLKTAEALFAEIAQMAAPPPIYPSLSAAGLEDTISHAAIPAKRLLEIAARLRLLVAIELIVSAQAVEMAGAEGLAPGLRPVLSAIREISPLLGEDRSLAGEIEAVAAALETGRIRFVQA